MLFVFLKYCLYSFFRHLNQRINELKQSLEDGNLARGLVHGDAFLDNAMFHDDGSLVGLIDFEEVSCDALVLDVAMCVAGCCFVSDARIDDNEQHSDTVNESLSIDLVEQFIQGYQEKRRLTALEKKCLLSFCEYACLAIAFWRFRQYNIRLPNHTNQNTYKQMLNRFKMIENEFEKILERI